MSWLSGTRITRARVVALGGVTLALASAFAWMSFGDAAVWPLLVAWSAVAAAGAATVGVHQHIERRYARDIGRVVEAMAKFGRADRFPDLPGSQLPPVRALLDGVEALQRSLAGKNAAIDKEAELNRFDRQLQRGLDLADDVPQALAVAERALHRVIPHTSAELLLAEDARLELSRVAVNPSVEPPGCPVERTVECAAIRLGRTMRFPSSEALDACPKLREHVKSPCAAICVPMTVMGETLGVLHVADKQHGLPGRDQVRLLEITANDIATRVGMLQTLAKTEHQANTDSLTGLLNRRSFWSQAASAVRKLPEQEHSVVLCDLDHFKKLNDTAGHAMGDRALCLFAATLKGRVRPDDIVGRYGGEEFVVLLPGCNAQQATDVLERVRASLADAVADYGGPTFTASFGVATFPGDGADLDEVLRAADRRLYEAKRAGRNRVVAMAA